MFEDQRFILIGRLEALRVPAGDLAGWIDAVREALREGGERLSDLVGELEPQPSGATAGPSIVIGSHPSPDAAPKLSYATRDKVVRLIATAIQRLSNDRAETLSEQFSSRIDQRISELVENNRMVQNLKWWMFALVVVGIGGSLSALGMTLWRGDQAREAISEVAEDATTAIEREERSVKDAAGQFRQDQEALGRFIQDTHANISTQRIAFDDDVKKRLQEVAEKEAEGIRAEIGELRTQIDTARAETERTLAALDVERENHQGWVAGRFEAHQEDVDQRLAPLTTQLEGHEAAVAERLTKHDQKIGQRLGEVDGAVGRHAESVDGRLRQNSEAMAARLLLLETDTVNPAFARMGETVATAESAVAARLQAVDQDFAAIENSVAALSIDLTNRTDALNARVAASDEKLTEVVNGFNRAISERQRELNEVVSDLRLAIGEIDARVAVALENALSEAQRRFDTATDATLVQHEAALSQATPAALVQLATVTAGAVEDLKTDAQDQRDRFGKAWVQEANFVNGQRQAMLLTWSTMAETADVYAAQARAAIDTSVDGAPARVAALEGQVVEVKATVDELSTRLDGARLKEMVEGVTRAIGERQRQLTEATTDLRTAIDGIDTAVAVVRDNGVERARNRMDTAIETALLQHDEALAVATRRLMAIAETPHLETRLWIIEHFWVFGLVLVVVSGCVSFLVARLAARNAKVA